MTGSWLRQRLDTELRMIIPASLSPILQKRERITHIFSALLATEILCSPDKVASVSAA